MPKIGRVRVIGLNLEYSPSGAVVDGYEPASGAELISTFRHGTNLGPVAATLMHELDGA
jgi:hypothetical protein